MAHNCMMFSIASGMESRQKALFEAKVRALAGVEGVYVTDSGHGRVWYNTNLLLPLLTKVLAFYRTQPAATPATRKEIVKTDSTGFNAYRRNALISGLGLIGWQVFKKVSPGAFAGAYGLRSAFVLFAARDFISNGVLGMLKQRQANADSLTTTAVIASIVGRKPESSLTLLLLANLAEMLTTYTAERTRNHISSMLRLDQQYAWKVEDEYEQRVAVENLCPGDAIGVHLGEKICVDGQVIEGSASVDQSPITGEYIPVEKNREDYVYAGTVVKNGYLKIRVEKVGDATALARIVHMVEEAQSRRAPVQNFADKMANMLVPISFIAAGLVYGMTKDWQRVLNMLFIDYSCGLKLSTATAISAAIGRAARQGILVKGGNYVETLANIDTIVLDKTGTITVGKPQVVQVETMFGIEEKEIVVMAASAEYHSSHPLASAILEYAIEKGWKVPPHSSTETIVARGILAVVPDFEEVEGGDIIVGSPQFMEENKIACQGFIERGQIHGECGHSVVYVARNRKLLGIMVINDPVRPNLKKTINRLRRQGIDEVIMITGDNEKVARYVAAEL
ncbi:MAG TPA: heavy metal translocating P-type ATPase, partial [Negativicutes bacterium]